MRAAIRSIKLWCGFLREDASDAAKDCRHRQCGPMDPPGPICLHISFYTQTKALIDTVRKKLQVDPGIESMSLVDPGIDGCLANTKYCSYRNRTLNGYPVTNLQSVGGEQMVFDEPRSMDTVVSINVIEHCEDAFEYLRRMDAALKPGGLLIFHDRVYDEFWKTIDPIADAKEVAGLHPLRIKRKLVDLMLEGRYNIVMLSTNLTDAMEVRKTNQITEEPIWLVARKK